MEMNIFPKDTNSGTANNSLSSSYDDLDIKGRHVTHYNHHSTKLEEQTLEDAIIYTPGFHVCSPGYTKSVGFDTLQAQNYANQDSTAFEKIVHEREINNKCSGGYLLSEEQREFASQIKTISLSSATTIVPSRVYSENDMRTILAAAQVNGTVFITEYHEAALAVEYNVSFVFVLSKEHFKLRDFKDFLWKKINNLRTEIKRLRVNHN